MRNKYPGTCYRCLKHVKAGDGHFERHHGRWRVQHADCAIKYRGQTCVDVNELKKVLRLRAAGKLSDKKFEKRLKACWHNTADIINGATNET